MEEVINNILSQNFEMEYRGWKFWVKNYHEIEKKFMILADNNKLGITESTFVEPKYLKDAEAFKKECRRFYHNRLDGMN